VGIRSTIERRDPSTSAKEMLDLIQKFNDDDDVDGILVQLPLPRGIDSSAILRRLDPAKDVDGFHPINMGKLLIGDESGFVPCTPYGIHEMLVRSHVSVEGKRVVVVGRSNIVGIPVSGLLRNRNATVTVCHSRTRDLPATVRRADIVIAAIGRPEMIRGDWIKPGATVIDVGINRVDDPSAPRGYRLVGDVAFDEVKEVAGAITPVPGGVGPMTIAMLLANTVRAAKHQQG
jgi:methylenetetrahydrofolate dehydrogenase (NADP+)/methenyltetrahydrofolate cyclohydrolase